MMVSNLWLVSTMALAITCVPACAADWEEEPQSGEEEPTLAETEDELVVGDDFTVAIQLADHGTSRVGGMETTPQLESSSNPTQWACDNNCWQPDSARIQVSPQVGDDIRHRDVRFCMQAADGRNSVTQIGIERCTPWASAGGGSTGLVTDADGRDPDRYRIRLESRNWPDGTSDRKVDLRFRIRGWDHNGIGAYSSWTGWTTEGGGTTSWGCDQNCYDPDGFEVEMGVRLSSLWSFCSPGDRCEHGFGDCDSNNDCVTGTVCMHDVGHQFGYANASTDVCVDN